MDVAYFGAQPEFFSKHVRLITSFPKDTEWFACATHWRLIDICWSLALYSKLWSTFPEQRLTVFVLCFQFSAETKDS